MRMTYNGYDCFIQSRHIADHLSWIYVVAFDDAGARSEANMFGIVLNWFCFLTTEKHKH